MYTLMLLLTVLPQAFPPDWQSSRQSVSHDEAVAVRPLQALCHDLQCGVHFIDSLRQHESPRLRFSQFVLDLNQPVWSLLFHRLFSYVCIGRCFVFYVPDLQHTVLPGKVLDCTEDPLHPQQL